MFFKIKAQKSSYEDAIHFLNSDAKSFYSLNHKFIDKDYETFFKSSLLTALVDLDRVIRGTFNCDIFLKNADLGSLKTMFPNAINNIFNIKTDEDIKKLGHLLEILRNINAHALLCDADFEFFKFDFSSLMEQKKMNSDICYFGNKGIMVAGVIFILLNFVREETIYNLINCDYILDWFLVAVTKEIKVQILLIALVK